MMRTGEPTPSFETAAAIDRIAAKSLLEWYLLAGADAAVDERPVAAWPIAEIEPSQDVAPGPIRATADAPATTSSGPSLLVPESKRAGHARAIASNCRTLADIEAALRSFEGCALKSTAKQLCFADGNPEARLMLIGEAPGAEEDRQGKPFVGPSGQLLDRILAEIGIDRTRAWITNVIYWRPPGNRPPTTGEIAVCLPFLERQIEILRPAFIVFVGGIAAKALLGLGEGVTRLRGRPMMYRTAEGHEIPCLVTFHPAYLLRQPTNKRFVWRDMLQLRERLDALGLA